jgi:hypothetical protein
MLNVVKLSVMLNIVILSVVMLSVTILSVFMLSVVAAFFHLSIQITGLNEVVIFGGS